MSNAIKAENVSVSFGSVSVLLDVSFEIERGSITAVIGPNGSGKTTLLRTLLGAVKPDEGSVFIFGKAPKDARTSIGYVPQRFTFDRHFPVTVGEFMSFSCPQAPGDKIKAYLQHLYMDERLDDLLGNLSGGQLQRVLIARALLRDPEVLLLDEPASGIDIGVEESFYELVKHVTEEHQTTTIIVSHEIDVVYNFADQVLCVSKKLLCQGVPHEVLTGDILQLLYGKEAALYRHDKKKGKEL